MQRSAWLSQRMTYGHDLAMGNFTRVHCGWVMTDSTVSVNGKGMGVKGRLKAENWRDVKQMDAMDTCAAFLLRDGTVRTNRPERPYVFKTAYLEGVRQVVMGIMGELLALMEGGTLRGRASRGLEHWNDLVWVTMCDHITNGRARHSPAMAEYALLAGTSMNLQTAPARSTQ